MAGAKAPAVFLGARPSAASPAGAIRPQKARPFFYTIPSDSRVSCLLRWQSHPAEQIVVSEVTVERPEVLDGSKISHLRYPGRIPTFQPSKGAICVSKRRIHSGK